MEKKEFMEMYALVRKNAYKVKNVVYNSFVKMDDEKNVAIFEEVSLIGAIVDIPSEQNLRHYSTINVLTVHGEVKTVDLARIIDIKATRQVTKELRRMIEDAAKIKELRDKKNQELTNIILKKENEIRGIEEEFGNAKEDLKKSFKKLTNLSSAKEVSMKMAEDFQDRLIRLQKYNHYNRSESFGDTNCFVISARSVKYPNESDFPGLIYREYDHSLHISGSDEEIALAVKNDLKDRGLDFDGFMKFNGFENELIRIRVTPEVEIGDKTTSTQISIDVDYKKEYYSKEDIEKIKEKIGKIIP